ncbi:hypothetical protein NKI41_32200 [Mesorhizobium sp. M0601]
MVLQALYGLSDDQAESQMSNGFQNSPSIGVQF